MGYLKDKKTQEHYIVNRKGQKTAVVLPIGVP